MSKASGVLCRAPVHRQRSTQVFGQEDEKVDEVGKSERLHSNDWSEQLHSLWKGSLLKKKYQSPREQQTLHLGEYQIDDRGHQLGAPRNELDNGRLRHISKRPRRRTIYVPDDTTVLTIHPGSVPVAVSGSALSFHVGSQSEPNGQDSKALDPRTRLRHALATAPKRAPLQPTLKPLQETREDTYACGPNTGKENIPPKNLLTEAERTNYDRMANSKVQSTLEHATFGRGRTTAFHCSSTPKSSVKPSLRLEAGGKNRQQELRSLRAGSPSLPACTSEDRHCLLRYGRSLKRAAAAPKDPLAPPAVPNAIMPVANQDSTITSSNYPLLKEIVHHAEMYEETWLSNQQTALTELLNCLFQLNLKTYTDTGGLHQGRKKAMLAIYQDHNCMLARKRLQASLIYGKLDCPPRTGGCVSRHVVDVGLRQSLMNFWLGTYSLSSLAPALEVVIDRKMQILVRPRSNTVGEFNGRERNVQTEKGQRKAVERFLGSCLIDNRDASEIDRTSSSSWCWRRTMLRSLMLILLLDKAKDAGSISSNLFRRGSKYKSSADAVDGLMRILNPSVAGTSRILTHLNYDLRHVQNPISEHDYKVTNLALDFRNGIKLSRLVELLLYSSDLSEENLPMEESTSRNTSSAMDVSGTWPVSRYLIIPCNGRVQKLHNVQVALSALDCTVGSGAKAHPCKAVDIVDGHRERTMALLWSLISNHGLRFLIDSTEVAKEIKRIVKPGFSPFREEDCPQGCGSANVGGLDKQALLLYHWAQAIATRHQGLHVCNLTTSFADGRVFEAIVEEYSRFMLCRKGDDERSGQKVSGLKCKLLSTECCKSFGNFQSRNIVIQKSKLRHLAVSTLGNRNRNQDTMLDSTTTVAALAYLCSRLLPPSREGRAAAIILRAYRESRLRHRIQHDLSSRRLGLERKQKHQQRLLHTAARKNAVGDSFTFREQAQEITINAESIFDVWLQ